MRIEVFGPGCAKCENSAKVAEDFLAARGIDGTVEKVKDITKFAARGVMITPAIFVDGEKLVAGRVLREKDLAAWLERHPQ
jgi:small redox-active disulfide protein 2